MREYLTLLEDILNTGQISSNRTGEDTISKFGMQLRFNLQKGFPAVTTKKLAFKAVVSELLWFIEGSTDENRLKEILHGDANSNKSTIWTANANSDYWVNKANFKGHVGKIYGYQWRNFNGIDQIRMLIDGLKNDPHSRRHILTAWNPSELSEMCLPPCHCFVQFHVDLLTEYEIHELYFKHRGTLTLEDRQLMDIDKDGNSRENRKKTIEDLQELALPIYKLSCQLYQRSADSFLGIPFNIASYSLLTHMLAQICNYTVGDFIHTFGDAHIYTSHIDVVKQQISRDPYPLPSLWINPKIQNIENFTMDDFTLLNYKHHDMLSAPMIV